MKERIKYLIQKYDKVVPKQSSYIFEKQTFVDDYEVAIA
jgi:hypothetical protein